MKSIAKSEAHPSPQALITHYPLTQMHHWFTMAQWPVRRMKAYLDSCEGPTPVAEALRQMYLDVLRECEQRLQVSLPPDLAASLAQEDTQLNRACARQRTHRVGVRRRTAAPAQMAADYGGGG